MSSKVLKPAWVWSFGAPSTFAGASSLRLPGVTTRGHDDVTQDIPSLCKSTTETCLGPFRRLLADLSDPPVTCVVSDVVMGFSIDATKELGLPYVQLWTASTISFLGYRHYHLLKSRGLAPLKS